MRCELLILLTLTACKGPSLPVSGEGANIGECDNELDDDGDGLLDCDDTGCAGDLACTGTDDSGDSGDSGEDPGGVPPVLINEFMASNSMTLADDEGGYGDWIELYNPTGQAVDLDGWSITDDLSDPTKFTLSGLALDPGGYLILWADGDVDDGDIHLSFKLSSDGEDLGLYTDAGVTVDALTYEAQATDYSAARVPNGSDTWVITDAPTPGASNGGG